MTTNMRRTPQSARGEQRISKILDAADSLFAEVGYEATTTNAIAARANTSIGSLYQFFPNKEAILADLAARYQAQMLIIFDQAQAEATSRSLEDFIDHLVDNLFQLEKANPGFKSVFGSSPLPGQTPFATDAMHEAVVNRTAYMIGLRWPSLSTDERVLCANIAISLVKSLLPLAEQSASPRQEQVLVHLKLVLVSYMQAFTARLNIEAH